jgi:hypothetical protein
MTIFSVDPSTKFHVNPSSDIADETLPSHYAQRQEEVKVNLSLCFFKLSATTRRRIGGVDVYLLTYLLTYSMVQDIIRKAVTQLVKKYPAFLCNPKVHDRDHTSPPLDPILSQLNPVRSIDSCLPKFHLNVILSPTPRSSQWSLAFGPPNQNPLILTLCVPHVQPTSSSLI